MSEATTLIVARRFYEVYASERWSEPVGWDALSADLQGVWARTAERLMREAAEQREEWTRAYMVAEAERLRAELTTPVSLRMQEMNMRVGGFVEKSLLRT